MQRATSWQGADLVFALVLASGAASMTPIAQAQVPGADQSAAGAARTNDADVGHIEEVVVTARRREESLQRVPISVTAIGADELESRSIQNLSAVSESTPNFTFGQQPQGGRASNVVFIRGVGQRDTLAVYDAAVGIYLDGVYMGRMQANDLDMLEIERIEVLRGPQGTLFGKNTSGGAVSIVTKQPDASADGLSGKFEITAGSRDRLDFVGSVNVPIVTDKAALQLAASRRGQDGYGERADGQDTNDADRESYRAQLLLAPTDSFSAVLSADFSHFDEANTTFKLVGVNSSIGTIGALNFFTDPDYDDTWLAPDDYFSFANGPNSSRGDLWGAAMTLTYETAWGAIKSITAYRSNELSNEIDPDQAPITVIDQFQSVDQDQLSQELQATGTAMSDRLDWVAGLYYFDEDARDVSSYNLLTPLLGNVAGFSQDLDITNQSYAAYAQGTYSFTDRLRMTLGLRYTNDDKEVTRRRPQFPTGVPLQPTTTKSRSSDAISPRAGLDYQWTPDVMTYVSVAQGYKGGGFNGRAGSLADFNEFEDETVWTYEVGLRSDLLDRTLRLNLTAFYSDYEDLQLPINGSQIVNGAPSPFSSIVNIPKSRITGGELELVYVPLPGLTLSGGLGVVNAEYRELPTDPRFVAAGTIDLDNEFPNTPEVTWNVGAEYGTYVSDALKVTGRVDYAWKNTIFYNPENTPFLRQPSYGVLNARLTFALEDSGWSLGVFGTNLTDERYFVGGYDDAQSPSPALGFAIVNMAAPREWGVSAQLRF